MLLANLDLDRGLVNGSMGIVTSISHQNDLSTLFQTKQRIQVYFPHESSDWLKSLNQMNSKSITILPQEWMYHHPSKNLQANASQFPLRVAWALTIHKCQGLTLDKGYINLSGRLMHTPGLVYTTLSQFRYMEVLVCQPRDSPILLIALDLFEQRLVPTDIVTEYQVSHPLFTKTMTFWTNGIN